MAFVVAEVLEGDIPEIARLANRVFHADPLRAYILPYHDPERMYSWRMKRVTKAFHDQSVIHHKVVDTRTKAIVAYAAWVAPRPTEPEEGAQDAGLESDKPGLDYPEGTNFPIIREIHQDLDRVKMKYYNKSIDYYLHSLLVLPEYQGNGLGSMLLRQGLKRIDSECRRCYLESTPAGLSAYSKFGWVVMDEIRTAFEDAGDGPNARIEITSCMLRHAALAEG